MKQQYEIAGLDLPHTSAEHKLRRLLSSAWRNRGENGELGKESSIYPYWDATYFHLHQVKIFQESSESEQNAILHLANCLLLEEAYFVEKAGMGYMAKMVLLAENTEERMLYALFSANEATHLHQISPFLANPEPVETNNAFLHFLAGVLESQDKMALLFVIQVVLEGWGLSHYRHLAQNCRDRALSQLFQGFLVDEARHHTTGILSFKQRSLSPASQSLIIEVLRLFLGMVQVGPQGVLAAIAQVKGHLSREQKIRILEELETEIQSGIRLRLLHSLMGGEKGNKIIQVLEEQGAFHPLPASQCVTPLNYHKTESIRVF
jgi:hypothetical protein